MLIVLSVFAAPQFVSCYEAFAQAYDQVEKLKAEERSFAIHIHSVVVSLIKNQN